MAKRDGQRPQLDFPQLTADLIDQLQIRGPVGLLDFSDVVAPVFIVGARGLNVTAEAPVFAEAEVSFGEAFNPGAAAQIFTTPALDAGTYDLFASISYVGATAIANGNIRLQHLNAAGTTLALLLSLPTTGTFANLFGALPLIGYQIADQDRIRLINNQTAALAGSVSGTVGLRLRPIP